MDFDRLATKGIPAPFKPKLDDLGDLRYFSEEFTQMKMSPDNDSINENPIIEEEFKGFEYKYE